MSEETKLRQTLAHLEQQLGDWRPEIAIVLGSGLGEFVAHIEVSHTLSYAQIPNFKTTTVFGHSGNLIFGDICGKRVVCQQGRYHYYEGHTIQEVVFPVRVMQSLGATSLIVTNAAGGINETFQVGDIMLITDHINFQGTNPLIGPNLDSLGTRFPDMTYTYDPQHAERLRAVAKDLDIPIQEGVYIGVSGPTYETPAEIRAFRTLGADAVGMSTVPEVIAAHHSGMRVLGLSCIANAAAGMTPDKLNHEEVKGAVDAVGDHFERLVSEFIAELA